MNLTDSEKLMIASKIKTFQDIQEGLGLFMERIHNDEERIDLDSLTQTVLDQNYQLKIVKDLLVTLFGIQELDSNKDTYLSKFYPA